MKDFVEKVAPIEGDAALHSFLNELTEHVAVPVLDDDGSIQGIISMDDVAQRSHPIKTKASSIARNTTSVALDAEPRDAVLGLLSGPYRAVPVLDGDDYVGLATERSVLVDQLLDEIEIGVEELMNPPITTEQDVTVGRVRSIMRSEDIGRLPVIDGERLVGIVGWEHLLALNRPKSKQEPGDRRGGFTVDEQISVSSVMDQAPLTIGRQTPIREAVRDMQEAGVSYAIVIEDREPVGIFTCQDLLELIGAQAPEEGLYVQISGVQDLEGMSAEHLHDHIQEAGQKVARVHGGVEFLYLHVKRYEEDGSQAKWSLRTRLMTPAGPYFAKGHGYGLLETVDDVMDRLERQVKKDISKTRDQRRQPYEFEET